METVKVRRNELLEKLSVNRDNHRTLFLEAQQGYRELVIQELDRSLRDAREGREIRTFIRMEAPQDHTGDYDTVIAMLNMSVDDTVELSSQEFRCFVQDQWQWAHAALVTNSAYAEHAKSLKRL
jgi:hypothetical protein